MRGILQSLICGHSQQSENKVIDYALFFNGKDIDSFSILTIEGEAKKGIVNSR